MPQLIIKSGTVYGDLTVENTTDSDLASVLFGSDGSTGTTTIHGDTTVGASSALEVKAGSTLDADDTGTSFNVSTGGNAYSTGTMKLNTANIEGGLTTTGTTDIAQTLELKTGTVSTLTGGNLNLKNGATISGGELKTSGTGAVTKVTGTTFSVAGGAVNTVNAGQLLLGDDSTDVAVNVSAGSLTTTDATTTVTGKLTQTGGSVLTDRASGSSTLTLESGAEITGGSLTTTGSGAVTEVTSGNFVVDAASSSSSGSVTTSSLGQLIIGSADQTTKSQLQINGGSVTTSSSATTTIYGDTTIGATGGSLKTDTSATTTVEGAFSQSSGTVTTESAGTLNLNTTAEIKGGTLTTSGDDSETNVAGNYTQTAGDVDTLTGGALNLNGQKTSIQGGTLDTSGTDAVTTVAGTYAQTAGDVSTLTGGKLNLNSSADIDGGSLKTSGANAVTTVAGAYDQSNGSVSTETGGTLNLNTTEGTTTSLTGGSLTTTGTGATTNVSGSYSQTAGVVTTTTAKGELNLLGDTNDIDGGSLTTSAGGVTNATAGTFTVSAAEVKTTGAGSELNVKDLVLDNEGATLTTDDNADTTVAGTLKQSAGEIATGAGGEVTVTGAAEVTGGQLTFDGTSAGSANAGTINAQGGLSVSSGAQVVVEAGENAVIKGLASDGTAQSISFAADETGETSALINAGTLTLAGNITLDDASSKGNTGTIALADDTGSDLTVSASQLANLTAGDSAKISLGSAASTSDETTNTLTVTDSDPLTVTNDGADDSINLGKITGYGQLDATAAESVAFADAEYGSTVELVANTLEAGEANAFTVASGATVTALKGFSIAGDADAQTLDVIGTLNIGEANEAAEDGTLAEVNLSNVTVNVTASADNDGLLVSGETDLKLGTLAVSAAEGGTGATGVTIDAGSKLSVGTLGAVADDSLEVKGTLSVAAAQVIDEDTTAGTLSSTLVAAVADDSTGTLDLTGLNDLDIFADAETSSTSFASLGKLLDAFAGLTGISLTGDLRGTVDGTGSDPVSVSELNDYAALGDGLSFVNLSVEPVKTGENITGTISLNDVELDDTNTDGFLKVGDVGEDGVAGDQTTHLTLSGNADGDTDNLVTGADGSSPADVKLYGNDTTLELTNGGVIGSITNGDEGDEHNVVFNGLESGGSTLAADYTTGALGDSESPLTSVDVNAGANIDTTGGLYTDGYTLSGDETGAIETSHTVDGDAKIGGDAVIEDNADFLATGASTIGGDLSVSNGSTFGYAESETEGGDPTIGGALNVTGSVNVGDSTLSSPDGSKVWASEATIGEDLNVVNGSEFGTTGDATVGGDVLVEGDGNGNGSTLDVGGELTADNVTVTGGSTATVGTADLDGLLKLTDGASFIAEGDEATEAADGAIAAAGGVMVGDNTEEATVPDESKLIAGSLTTALDPTAEDTTYEDASVNNGASMLVTGETEVGDLDVLGGSTFGFDEDGNPEGGKIITHADEDSSGDVTVSGYYTDPTTNEKVVSALYAEGADIAGDLIVSGGAAAEVNSDADGSPAKVAGTVSVAGATGTADGDKVSTLVSDALEAGDLEVKDGAAYGYAYDDEGKLQPVAEPGTLKTAPNADTGASGNVTVTGEDSKALVSQADVGGNLTVSDGGAFKAASDDDTADTPSLAVSGYVSVSDGTVEVDSADISGYLSVVDGGSYTSTGDTEVSGKDESGNAVAVGTDGTASTLDVDGLLAVSGDGKTVVANGSTATVGDAELEGLLEVTGGSTFTAAASEEGTEPATTGKVLASAGVLVDNAGATGTNKSTLTAEELSTAQYGDDGETVTGYGTVTVTSGAAALVAGASGIGSLDVVHGSTWGDSTDPQGDITANGDVNIGAEADETGSALYAESLAAKAYGDDAGDINVIGGSTVVTDGAASAEGKITVSGDNGDGKASSLTAGSLSAGNGVAVSSGASVDVSGDSSIANGLDVTYGATWGDSADPQGAVTVSSGSVNIGAADDETGTETGSHLYADSVTVSDGDLNVFSGSSFETADFANVNGNAAVEDSTLDVGGLFTVAGTTTIDNSTAEVGDAALTGLLTLTNNAAFTAAAGTEGEEGAATGAVSAAAGVVVGDPDATGTDSSKLTAVSLTTAGTDGTGYGKVAVSKGGAVVVSESSTIGDLDVVFGSSFGDAAGKVGGAVVVNGSARIGSTDDAETGSSFYAESATVSGGDLSVFNGSTFTTADFATVTGSATVDESTLSVGGLLSVTGDTVIGTGSTASVGDASLSTLVVSGGSSFTAAAVEGGASGSLSTTGKVTVTGTNGAEENPVASKISVASAAIGTDLDVLDGAQFTSSDTLDVSSGTATVSGAGSYLASTGAATLGALNISGGTASEEDPDADVSATARFGSLSLSNASAIGTNALVYVGTAEDESLTFETVQQNIIASSLAQQSSIKDKEASDFTSILYIDTEQFTSNGITVGTSEASAATGSILVGSDGAVIMGANAFSVDADASAAAGKTIYTTGITNSLTLDAGGVLDLSQMNVNSGTAVSLTIDWVDGMDLTSILTGNVLYEATAYDTSSKQISFGFSAVGQAMLSDKLSQSLSSAIINQSNLTGLSTTSNDGAGFVARALQTAANLVTTGSDAEIAAASEAAGRMLESAARMGAQTGAFETSTMTVNMITGFTESRLGFNTAAGSPATVRLNGSSTAFSLAGAFADASTTMTDTQAPVAPDNAYADQGTVAWVTPVYSKTKTDGFDAGAFTTGVDAEMYGVAVGVDWAAGDNTRFGLAFHAGTGDIDSTGSLEKTSTDYDFYGFTVYGGREAGNWTFVGDVSFGYIDGEATQNNTAGAITADAKSKIFSASAKAKYTFETDAVDIAPYAGLRFNYVHMDGFEAKSAGTVLLNSCL
ncbi:autotransporter outer membrane beta-barrel domain-containing protein [Sutterella sp.]|uniref:beta strand repeat-containing protein n=1 Tax=Sutterella sp. TaxID=1981025 RepID=UPI0026DF6E43|nr:autotransporter outer membrane beta-barrel domain-containing protein [Sutterella sp.]MDO5532324.1 autotransporter outer membrane beta-barrel domain-containing protein [Sutterella sp.]